jgi:hypothetical protein
MPRATPSTRRRDLFGSAAALLLLAAPAAGPAKAQELDGDLLDLVAEFHDLHAELDRLAASDAPDDAYDAVNEDWLAVLEEAIALPARTPEGLRAKASLFLPAMRNMVADPPFAEVGHRLAHALVVDITGGVAT